MPQGEPFAACYYGKEDGRVFSLRSTEDGLDLSKIAKAYGRGHAHPSRQDGEGLSQEPKRSLFLKIESPYSWPDINQPGGPADKEPDP